MPDASEIKHGTMQFKKDKYIYEEEEYTIEGEWLNGVPHGVCILETEDRRGVYTFTNGKVNGGPAWWEMKQYGTRTSWEYLDNGEYKGVYREYYSDS
jgi:hypothetical protein